MKNKITWIYLLVHLFVIRLGDSSPNEPDLQLPDKISTVPELNDKLELKEDEKDHLASQVSTSGDLVTSDERGLKRRKRRGKSKRNVARRWKSKGKKSKKSGKGKKSRKQRRKEKKLRKKLEKLESLKSEDKVEDKLEDKVVQKDEQKDEEKDVEEQVEDKTDESSSTDEVSKSLDSLESEASGNSLDLAELPEDSEDSGDRTKKYWDYNMAEPEYLITEWFAILDGKKFDKKSGFELPYISDEESAASSEYLLDKKNKSKYLTNRYSSAWKYKDQDDDSLDYVKPIFVSRDSLLRTFPDTKEDELENRIIESKFTKKYGFDENANFHSSPVKSARKWKQVGHGRYERVTEEGDEQLEDPKLPEPLEDLPSEDLSESDDSGVLDPTESLEEVPREDSDEPLDEENPFSEFPLSEDPYESDLPSTRNSRLSDQKINELKERNEVLKKNCKGKVATLKRKYEKMISDIKKEAY